MKIGFILSNAPLMSTNGVSSQAKTWKIGLEELGHEVILINMWENNDWKSYNIIHFFGFSIYMKNFIIGLHKINPNIIISPILDPNYSIQRLKLYSKWGSVRLNLSNPYHALATVKDKIKFFFVRSKFEQEYMVEGFGIEENKCPIIELSYNIKKNFITTEKEKFCLHISLLADERKNVKRLIDAAKKYKFKLVLGGKLRNEEEKKLLNKWINNNEYIEYKGYLSIEEMNNLYSKAKVFALPSTNEGVGIVALEAGYLGCDVVITKLGGPKEYYNGLAKTIDPYDIDDIGKNILNLIENETYQPELSKHIEKNFSLNSIARKLEDQYKSLIN